MNYKIKKISKELFLIALNPQIKGFDDFICAWVYIGEKTILIDPGPAVTANDLLKALEELNIKHLDYILLTHIHMDHAGAIGDIASAFNNTKVVCHKKAIPHLISPEKLQLGTIKTLGQLALDYGPIKNVESKKIIDVEKLKKLSDNLIKPIETLGHSPHHVSYEIKDYLFVGEASGVSIKISDDKFYMRPATPPKFFFDIFVNSIDKLVNESTAKIICFGHYGISKNTKAMLNTHKNQLLQWKEIINTTIANNESENDNILKKCYETILKKDRLLENFSKLDKDIQNREKYFLTNSIKGFLGNLMPSGKTTQK